MPNMCKKNVDMSDVEFDTKNPTLVKREKAKRKEQRKKRKKFRIIRNTIIIILSIAIVSLVGVYIYFYSTDAFPIEDVQINGVQHLTDDEMTQLMDIPEDTTLLKVDTDTIKKRLKRDA